MGSQKPRAFQSGPVAQYPSEVSSTDPDPPRKQRQALRYISVTKWKELEKRQRELDQVYKQENEQQQSLPNGPLLLMKVSILFQRVIFLVFI